MASATAVRNHAEVLEYEDSGYRGPSATDLARDSVSALAEMTAQNLGYGPGEDIRTAVAQLGGRVKLHDFWRGFCAPEKDVKSLIVDRERNFTIRVDDDSGDARNRFTIAHDLGHYVLHFLWYNDAHPTKQIQRLIVSRYGEGCAKEAEWEANWFAFAFLMPEQSFRSHYESHRDIARIAEYFGVTEHAAEIRARSLGLIDR